jgi:uncharacterized protein YigA (DUF484 family)
MASQTIGETVREKREAILRTAAKNSATQMRLVQIVLSISS